MKNTKDIEDLVLGSQVVTREDKKKIFAIRFKTWRRDHYYIYKKFNLNFEAKILDIGSSYGGNLINFSKDSVGVEVNPEIVAFAKSIGLKIADINAEDELKSLAQKFDLIWCTDFLVHVISPYKFLYDARSLLDDGGKIVIQIPLMSIFDTHRSSCHFYAFNKKALSYLMEMAGYRVVKTSGYVRRLPNWLNTILEPVSQIWGGNIWILAVKENKIPVSLDKVFLPTWFKL